MSTMGATVQDVWREFIGRTEYLSNVVAYLVQYDVLHNRLSMTTLLDEPDVASERELANIELLMERQYQEQPINFSSVHLRGRDPEEFISAAADPYAGAALISRSPAHRRASAK